MSSTNIPRPTDASIILTYRCPMRCQMCNIWKNPTNRQEEIKATDFLKRKRRGKNQNPDCFRAFALMRRKPYSLHTVWYHEMAER